MIDWIELTHPQVQAYLRQETLYTFEKTLGSQNKVNRQSIREQLSWARDYVGNNFITLLPKGRYSFQKTPYFRPKELKELNPVCEMVFFLSIASSRKEKDNISCEEELLLSLLRTSVLDSTRRYLRQSVLPSLYKNCYQESIPNISPCFGPGLFSAELTELKEYFTYLKIPNSLAVLKGDMIEPLASFAGAYYGLKYPWKESICKNCRNHSNCQFCMNYNEN